MNEVRCETCDAVIPKKPVESYRLHQARRFCCPACYRESLNSAFKPTHGEVNEPYEPTPAEICEHVNAIRERAGLLPLEAWPE